MPGTLLRHLSLFLFWISALSPARVALGFDTSGDMWAMLAGYGQSVPGWGDTTERVEPRYSHRALVELGSGWYAGDYRTLIELPVHVVASPDESAMVGMNFLGSYTFTANPSWRPYLFGGGGPVYSFADIPGMGADWNGNYQFGVGAELPLEQTRSLLFELRYHHISNAGTEDPNVPLNSIKFLIGYSF